MPVPTPDQVAASDVNTELGKSGTELQYNWANTRNIACVSVTSGTEIQSANLNYGLRFPRESTGLGYNTTRTASVVSVVTVVGAANSSAFMALYANGTGYFYKEETNVGRTGIRSFTWLQSGGTNSNYYVNFSIDSGTGSPTSLTGANVDTVLSGTALLQMSVTRGTVGVNQSIRSGNAIFLFSTDGGSNKTEYFRRPITLDCTAERQ